MYCTYKQHTATHCNTLQHTATHATCCITLQNTTTHAIYPTKSPTSWSNLPSILQIMRTGRYWRCTGSWAWNCIYVIYQFIKSTKYCSKNVHRKVLERHGFVGVKLISSRALALDGVTDLSPLICGDGATHCNTLQHTATHCNTLQHTATHCNTLQRTATHCNALQHITTHCNTLQHTAIHYNTLQQHTATHYNTLQHTTLPCNTLQHTATHRDTHQRVATHCNTLQRTARYYNEPWCKKGSQIWGLPVSVLAASPWELRPVTLNYSKLQHTGTNCHTLQPTALSAGVLWG